jgi:hypothetical protein
MADMRLTAIGWRAHAALTASGGVAKVIATLSRSFYAEAAGELIWIGADDAILHPRAVLVTPIIPPASNASLHLVTAGMKPWRPPPYRREARPRMLRRVLVSLGSPRGFARLWSDDAPDDPILSRAAPGARALADACACDDASAFVAAAQGLIGLGEGLTPSGDDYVGGALFTRKTMRADDPAWEAATNYLVSEAMIRTHPVSARLLADLAAGEGWAALHDVVGAFGDDDARAIDQACRALTTLGSATGWDLLAGVVAAYGVDGHSR